MSSQMVAALISCICNLTLLKVLRAIYFLFFLSFQRSSNEIKRNLALETSRVILGIQHRVGVS